MKALTHTELTSLRLKAYLAEITSIHPDSWHVAIAQSKCIETAFDDLAFCADQLTIAGLIPTSEDGKPMELPTAEEETDLEGASSYVWDYSQAKQRVLFEGWEDSSLKNCLSVKKGHIELDFYPEHSNSCVMRVDNQRVVVIQSRGHAINLAPEAFVFTTSAMEKLNINQE